MIKTDTKAALPEVLHDGNFFQRRPTVADTNKEKTWQFKISTHWKIIMIAEI